MPEERSIAERMARALYDRTIGRRVEGVRDLFRGNFREAAGGLLPVVGLAQELIERFRGPGFDGPAASEYFTDRIGSRLDNPSRPYQSPPTDDATERAVQEFQDSFSPQSPQKGGTRNMPAPNLPPQNGPGGLRMFNRNPYADDRTTLGMDVRAGIVGPKPIHQFHRGVQAE